MRKLMWIVFLGLVAFVFTVQGQDLAVGTNSVGTHFQTQVANIGTRAVMPLLRAHAHNDYEHARPLFDALEAGFCSVEADVWLVDGKLLVAHEPDRVKPERTLQALYLEPLRTRIQANGGRVFREVPTVTLMIDVKSEAVATYTVLRQVLAEYGELLSEFTRTNTTPRTVTVILSGNRPVAEVEAEPTRYVLLDGRLADLDGDKSANLIPLVSDNWKLFFQWRGQGSFPDEERAKLKQWAQRAHQQGKRIRFWGAPDNATGWQELKAAGVDLISTDDLQGLAKFLSQ